MNKQQNIVAMIALFGVVYFSNAYAMRCGSELVNEGDDVTTLVSLCGQPTAQTNANLVYVNPNNDGMTYYIHVDQSGTIENISFSRN